MVADVVGDELDGASVDAVDVDGATVSRWTRSPRRLSSILAAERNSCNCFISNGLEPSLELTCAPLVRRCKSVEIAGIDIGRAPSTTSDAKCIAAIHKAAASETCRQVANLIAFGWHLPIVD